MSRLPAPGFSRLRAPGFTKSVTAASQVPLPDENPDEGNLQKPPPPPVSAAAPTAQKLTKGIPSSSGIRQPLKKPTGIKLANSTAHGPSPYDRSKPQIGHIPYVGKKRVTGTLKAPENKSSLSIKNNKTINKSAASNNSTLNQTKPTESDASMGNVNPSNVKPVKRQLIPSSGKSKLPPKQSIARPTSTTGIVQPRSMGPPRVNSPISTKYKAISRSLQTLPQNPQNKSKIVKSASIDNLESNHSNRPTIAKPVSKIGKPPALIRPRASSYKGANKLVNVVSTPCQPNQTQNKHLNKLKISPIVSNAEGEEKSGEGAENNTFDQGILATELPNDSAGQSLVSGDDSNSSFDVISNESIESAVKAPLEEEISHLNATYNKMNLTNTNKTLPVVKNDGGNVIDTTANEFDNSNSIKDLNQTHVISELVSKTQRLSANENENVTWTMPELNNNSASFLNQTHVIQKNSLQPNPDCNTTRVINKEEETSLNDSDFLEHQSMPLCEDTPLKTNITLNESFEDHSSFTDDILKVIAAISSNINTQPISSVVMTTSPIKQYGVSTEHVLHHELVHDNVFSPATSDMNSEVVSEMSTVRNSDTLDATSLQELELDPSAPRKPKSMSIAHFPESPTTPLKDDENDDSFFNIANRCYTVSAAELRRNKVSRRNTFQSHDSSRFRVPKEINMLETLEGNIMMDNTSFLQLCNDTRAVKTMLLKLKRTLLEVDCPSPLVKVPLKRSNSCSVRRTGDSVPPLSPRLSLSSPMAVVDPYSTSESLNKEKTSVENVKKNLDEKIPDKIDSMTSLTEKFQESLRRNEELEKELECNKYTIRLLQTQLETTEQKEQDMLEENIILREEVNHLNDRLKRLSTLVGVKERTLSSSGSYKEEFDMADVESRKGILRRMYSNDTSSNE